MQDFLDKLGEDQARFRKFLAGKATRLRKMGEALAYAREHGARVLLAGEPPLDHLASLLALEFFEGLGARVVDARGGFAKNDVLVVLAHDGRHAETAELMARAGSKGARVLLVGTVDAQASLRSRADLSLGLPMRGVKTVSESTLVIARILARIARTVLDAIPTGPPPLESAPSESAERAAPTRASPTRFAQTEPVLEPLSDVETKADQRVEDDDGGIVLDDLDPDPEPAPLAKSESLLTSLSPQSVVRFALGAFPEDASGPAHRVERLSPEKIVFVLDPGDEAGATLEAGDTLWVRLEYPETADHVCLKGRVSSIDLGSETRVELVWSTD